MIFTLFLALGLQATPTNGPPHCTPPPFCTAVEDHIFRDGFGDGVE
jgi:hypothetical protein